jgi:hypothetical protein
MQQEIVVGIHVGSMGGIYVRSQSSSVYLCYMLYDYKIKT